MFFLTQMRIVTMDLRSFMAKLSESHMDEYLVARMEEHMASVPPITVEYTQPLIKAIFSDGIINWGRITTAVVFSQKMCKNDPQKLEEAIVLISSIVDPWIKNQRKVKRTKRTKRNMDVVVDEVLSVVTGYQFR